MSAIEILISNKAGLNSKESYVVVRGKTSFLRILGCEPEWELMTATANEDHSGILVCSNQLRLVEAALRLGAELGTEPSVEKDRLNREYVKICGLKQDPDRSDEMFEKELLVVFDKFFAYYDNYQDCSKRGYDEMKNLYDALATDYQGGDIYLSDGVWLSSDGSVHDRGR
ncbi:TPA: hypothetical protein ACSP13_002827 [Aeromonas veronii]|uniref:hypothetical protein n=1 Tax=Aeromonas veronii TaxID=654 RepID=UPI003D1A4B35